MHASLADIVADVAANSIEAGASRTAVKVVEEGGKVVLSVVDNGKGMDKATLERAFNPFYTEPGKHDKRKIGMGLPFVKQTCDACGGEVSLSSEKGKGTSLVCTFRADSIDLPPMGSLPETALSLFNFPGDFDLEFTHRKGKAEYTISRLELMDACGGFDTADSLALAREFLESQEAALDGEEASAS